MMVLMLRLILFAGSVATGLVGHALADLTGNDALGFGTFLFLWCVLVLLWSLNEKELGGTDVDLRVLGDLSGQRVEGWVGAR